jgi:hypothetical protein
MNTATSDGRGSGDMNRKTGVDPRSYSQCPCVVGFDGIPH